MRHAAVSFVLLFACCPASALEVPEEPRTNLSVLLDEAGRASPRLLALTARQEAASNLASQRQALPDPKLSASYTNDGLTSFTLGDSEFANLTVGWEQEVPTRAVRRSAAAVAETQAATLRASRTAAEATLRARVIALYAELWRLDRTRALLDESRGVLTANVDATQARYESGTGIQEGLVRAQSAVHRLDLELEELVLSRRRTEIALGAALGRTDDSRFGPTGELPDIAGSIEAESVAAAAAASSPEVIETTSRQTTAQAALDDARAQVKPTWSWLAAYQYRGGLDPMVTGGFAVRLPVWKDRKQERAIAAATADRRAAAEERNEALVAARSGARELAAELQSIDVRLRLYREALVPQAQAAFESASAAFASGRAEMFLVLDDLDRWIGARREQLALAEARVRAAASLEAVTGATLLELPSARSAS